MTPSERNPQAEESEKTEEPGTNKGLKAFLTGEVISLKEVGDGFSCFVKEGDRVKAGDPLIQFDREKIKKAGLSDVTICVVTDPGEGKNIAFHTGIHGEAGSTEIIRVE